LFTTALTFVCTESKAVLFLISFGSKFEPEPLQNYTFHVSGFPGNVYMNPECIAANYRRMQKQEHVLAIAEHI
jgi:hypothetical protein